MISRSAQALSTTNVPTYCTTFEVQNEHSATASRGAKVDGRNVNSIRTADMVPFPLPLRRDSPRSTWTKGRSRDSPASSLPTLARVVLLRNQHERTTAVFYRCFFLHTLIYFVCHVPLAYSFQSYSFNLNPSTHSDTHSINYVSDSFSPPNIEIRLLGVACLRPRLDSFRLYPFIQVQHRRSKRIPNHW